MKTPTTFLGGMMAVLLSTSFFAAVYTGHLNLAALLAPTAALGLIAFMQIVSFKSATK